MRRMGRDARPGPDLRGVEDGAVDSGCLDLEDSAISLDDTETIFKLNYLHPRQIHWLLGFWLLLSHSKAHLREYVSAVSFAEWELGLAYLPKGNLRPLNPCLLVECDMMVNECGIWYSGA